MPRLTDRDFPNIHGGDESRRFPANREPEPIEDEGDENENDGGPTGNFYFMVPVVVQLDGGLVVAVTVIDETTPIMSGTVTRDAVGDLTSGNSTLCDDSSSQNDEADRLHLASLIDAALDGQDWPSWEFGF